MNFEIKKIRWTFPVLLFFAVFFRLINFGNGEFNTMEAENALTAVVFSQNQTMAAETNQMLYTGITSVLFRLFGTENGISRLIPVLCGIIFCFLPMINKERFSVLQRIILTFFFAFDASLIFWSKQADSLSIVLLLLGFILTSIWKNHFELAWFIAGIVLTGGIRFWPIFIPLGLFLILHYYSKGSNSFILLSKMLTNNLSKKNLILFLSSFLLTETVFFTNLMGFGSFGKGFLDSFVSESFSSFRLGFLPTLIICGVYLFIPGLFSIIRWIKDLRALTIDHKSFIIHFFYIVPLFFLIFWNGLIAMPVLSVLLVIYSTPVIEKVLLSRIYLVRENKLWIMSIPFIFFFFFLMRIIEIINIPDLSSPLVIIWKNTSTSLPVTKMTGYLVILTVSILITVLLIRIISSFIETKNLWDGVTLGFIFILLIGTFLNAWESAGLMTQKDRYCESENIERLPALAGLTIYPVREPLDKLLMTTSINTTGSEKNSTGINLIKEPLLLWNIRKYQRIQTMDSPAVSSYFDILDRPTLILAETSSDFTSQQYIGTTLQWGAKGRWDGLSLEEWFTWIIYRETKGEQSNMNFWVRTEEIFGDHVKNTEVQ